MPIARRSGIISPPPLASNALAISVRLIGSSMSAIAGPSILNISKGDLLLNSSKPTPSSPNAIAALLVGSPAASTIAICSLLIIGPTLSAPTPAFSKARWRMARLPAVSPVRAERSFSWPPMATAALKAWTAARTPIKAAPIPTTAAAIFPKWRVMPALALAAMFCRFLAPLSKPAVLSEALNLIASPAICLAPKCQDAMPG